MGGEELEDREIVEKLFFRDDTALEELEKKYGKNAVIKASHLKRKK